MTNCAGLLAAQTTAFCRKWCKQTFQDANHKSGFKTHYFTRNLWKKQMAQQLREVTQYFKNFDETTRLGSSWVTIEVVKRQKSAKEIHLAGNLLRVRSPILAGILLTKKRILMFHSGYQGSEAINLKKVPKHSCFSAQKELLMISRHFWQINAF